MRRILSFVLAVLLSVALLPSVTWAQKTKAVLLLTAVATSGNWDVEGYKAFKAMGDKYGMETSVVERASYAKASQIMRDYASRGYGLIIAHSAGYGGAAIEVAREFPKSWFVIFSDLRSTGGRKNVAGWAFNWNEYGYLEGTLAGLMTKSNKIGIVAPIPIPSITRLLGGFMDGVKSVNTKAQVDVIWVQSWSDPAKGKEAALQLVARGADLLTHTSNITGWGIFEAAKQKKVWTIGNFSDESERAPQHVITSGILDFRRGYDEIGRLFKSGKLEAKVYRANISNGDIYLTRFHKAVPPDVSKQVNGVKAKIASGDLKIRNVMYKPKKR
ncbi:MAG: BMP family protein [Nitrospinota bacterium]